MTQPPGVKPIIARTAEDFEGTQFEVDPEPLADVKIFEPETGDLYETSINYYISAVKLPTEKTSKEAIELVESLL